MDSSNAEGGELPFERPQTAREKAAAEERSKRDAEMAELRRMRSEKGPPGGGAGSMFGAQLTAPSEAARRKRTLEMEEIRKLKAIENRENRERLSAMAGPLTTDMDAWRSNQWGAKDADRKKKLEAQSNLQEHRGLQFRAKTDAELDKAALTQAQRERVAEMKMKGLSLDDDEGNPYPHPEGGTMEGGRWMDENADTESCVKPGSNVMFKDVPDETIPVHKENGGRTNRVSFSSKVAAAHEAPPPQEGAEDRRASMEKQDSKVMFKDAPDEQIPIHKDEDRVRVSFSSKADAQILSPEDLLEAEGGEASPKVKFDETEPESELKSPPPENIVEPAPPAPRPLSFSRVDIKFSFGLIVRSSAADGLASEDLRENETLRKCMEGTSKILHVQLPSPPEDLLAPGAEVPDAYYDPTLEPTIISIEEDKREGGEEGKRKATAKGNKRTLVKASFPVFLRDEEGGGEEGEKRISRMLKETKTTVFKALRAAVSGGSFLR